MKEKSIQKINKIGKIGGVIALICKILVALGIAILVLGSILCFCIPKDGVNYATEKTNIIEVDAEKLATDVTEEQLDKLKADLENEMTAEIESGAVDITVDGENFVPAAIERTEHGFKMIGVTNVYHMDFRDLAWGLLLLAVLLGLTQITLYFVGFLCKAFRDCESPFEENVIKKMQNLAYALIPWTFASSLSDIVVSNIFRESKSIALSVDLGVVLIVLVVFLLVYIFKYGAILQQESDETL
ncbi:MAG: DUF2975 domain-containing protein [Lachnospiraceae bacterium]|nr:DUF2975 domain-containing protein [Lachnospiraceae bacterium]